MEKFINFLMLFISCFSICCLASENIESAREFMNEFLEGEYRGDMSLRLDNAMYSPERKLWVKKNYSPMIGEIPQWDCDKICVVDAYEIKEIKITSHTAIIDVEFQEFAHTDGEKGYAHSPLIKTGNKIIESYNLEYKDGRWWIYDPPIPRVSKKAIIDFNNSIINSMGEWVLREGSDPQKEYYYNLVNTNKLLKEDE